MPRFATHALVAGALGAFALASALAFGPLDPPAGEVTPTGPSLGDLGDAISALGGPRSSGFTTFDELNAFIEVDGVDGEATQPFANDWTELEGFVDLGLRAPASTGRMVSEAVVSEEVRVLISNGAVSRDMLNRLAGGIGAYADVTVHLYTTGSSPVVYQTLKMDVAEVIAIQYRPESRAAEVTLRADKYTWTQYMQNQMGVNQSLPPVEYIRAISTR